MPHFDLIIIGAGIVGAATAWQCKLRNPGMSVLVLEKEPGSAFHQTGRNSGVIHAGVYYAPGSLKADYCRRGLEATYAFCEQYDIPCMKTGKLLVATNDIEMQRMENLFERCKRNHLNVEWLDKRQLIIQESHISGLGAIWVKDTGITDYKAITHCMLRLFEEMGGRVAYNQQVVGLEEFDAKVSVTAEQANYSAERLVSCGGLMSDRLIKMLGIETDFQIIPFRGEYFRLPSKYNHIVKHLIYPVPDPELPFLGVHLTRMIDGSVTVGPNAVLAMAREAYRKTQFNLHDLTEMLSFSGFSPLIKQHLSSGLTEIKHSLFKSGYLKRVQKYCPGITQQDLLPYPSGIRAQAVSNVGELIHDFKFVESSRTLHVGNAPSPAATSAIPIAESIISKLNL